MVSEDVEYSHMGHFYDTVSVFFVTVYYIEAWQPLVTIHSLYGKEQQEHAAKRLLLFSTEESKS